MNRISEQEEQAVAKFQKGQSGNPGGRPAGVHEAAKRALQAIADAATPEKMKQMATVLVQQAAKGDHEAIQILLDRLAGKAKQAVELDRSMQLPRAVQIITPMTQHLLERRRAEN